MAIGPVESDNEGGDCMNKPGLWLAAAALLAMSTTVSAGESTGYYTTTSGKEDVTTLPDGRMIVVSHYYQLSKSDKADDPINGMDSDCIGHFLIGKDGKMLSGSGSCVSHNGQGDGSSWWWKVDEMGTAKCPDACGSFGYVEGFGKLKGVTGGGTWVRTDVMARGSMGTYKLKYKR
jgi:hypothetical protein